MSQRRSTESSSSSAEDSSSTSEDEDNTAIAVLHGGAEWLNDWQLATLLEHLCSLYVPDQQSSLHKQVFKLLYTQLKKLKIECPVADLEDVRNIRRQCSTDFNELVKDALNMLTQPVSITLSADIQQRVDILLRPRNFPTQLMVPGLSKCVALYTSRYNDEFAETHPLGKGGYGVVFHAKHKLDNCNYAVKKIYVCDTEPSEWIQMLQEVFTLAELSHVNVVRYHGVWLEHNNPYTAPTEQSTEITEATIGSSSSGSVEFLPQSENGCYGDQVNRNVTVGQQEEEPSSTSSSSGDRGDSSESSWCLSERSIMKRAMVILHIQMELCVTTLANWLDEKNQQTPTSGESVYSLVAEDKSKKIMREILEGVKYIHSKNIIHRDLKPENIFHVTADGDGIHVKIGDFGLSRKDTQNMPNASRQETVAGGGDGYTTDVGTRSYAAPEQLETTSYSTKADMFSVGLMLFELYQPFTSNMEKAMNFKSIRNQQLPEAFTEHWPSQARCILNLVGEADQRPSAEEMITEAFLRSHEELLEFVQKRKVESKKQQIVQLENEVLLQKETIAQQHETIARQHDTIAQQNNKISQQEQEILRLKENNSQQE